MRSLLAAVVGAVLLMLTVTTYVLGVTQPRVQDYTAITRELRVSHEAMLDQETGLRAWLATGDRRFLQPYESGRDAAAGAQARLRGHLHADDELASRLVDLALAQQSWQQQWAKPALQRPVGAPVADTARFLVQGKESFDVYRRVSADAVAVSAAGRDAAMRVQQRALQGLALSQVILGALAVAVLLRRTRRLVELLEAPVQLVEGAIARIHRGEVLGDLPASGAGELDDVVAALVQLSQDLDRERATSQAQQADVRRSREQLEAVLAAGRAMAACTSSAALAGLVVRSSAELTGGLGSLWVRTEQGPHGCVAWSDPLQACTDEHAEVVAAAATDGRRREGPDHVALPLIGSGQVLAVLHVAFPDALADGAGTPAGCTALETLTVSAAAHWEAVQLHEATRERAAKDQLTGLGNRHTMQEEMSVEWARSTRHGRPLSLGMIDLDHFKKINDTGGHLAGDAWLKLVAEVVGAQLRSSDRVYRYGGEEIAVMLPETAEDDAAVLFERIRAAIEGVRGPDAAPSATASIGVAELRPGMLEPEDLIGSADRALYAAKRAGRNLVVRAGVLEPGRQDPQPTGAGAERVGAERVADGAEGR